MTSYPESLSDAEAAERLKAVGPNALPNAERKGWRGHIAEVAREPMLALLVVVSGLYFLLGEPSEGLILGASAVFVVGLVLYQNAKSERALEALRDLTSPRALVVRAGEEKRIPASQLVPGDLVVLSEGDRVPADGFLLQAAHLQVDESLLTGEAFPVKKEEAVGAGEPGEASRAFMGTLVVAGKGFLRVAATGPRTEMGKIGGSLATVGESETFLAREVGRLVKFFAWGGGLLCAGVTAMYVILRGDWATGVLAGLATAMSLLPEEFAVVLTVFLALGAWRLSRVKVLIRRPAATERLGALTVLCVDKTGTITENRMTVGALDPEAPGGEAQLLRFGALASHPRPFDPMEKALHAAASGGQGALELAREFPLSRELFATSFAWRQGQGYLVATKGAPEAVSALCRLSPEKAEAVRARAHALAGRGLRILGVAKAEVAGLPETQAGLPLEWLGLVGFEDPVRPEVPAAVARCRRAGVKVLMITGDYPETARIVAEKAGIGPGEVLTGAEVGALGEEELGRRLAGATVFARMRPEQKLRIVRALHARGEVTAMTGDGVNDAPSLKAADVGIAMGARGTDVAREAAGLVLTDDNFASIVAGIERGRSIFENLRRSLSYIISIHVPLAGLALFPVVLGWPMLLMPVHIVLLELIIDPACSLLFESQEPEADSMLRPPRRVDDPLFSARELVRCGLEGLLILVPCLLLFSHEMRVHADENTARAVAFLFLGTCNVGLILADLTAGRLGGLRRLAGSRLHLGLLAGVLALLVAIAEVPWLAALFRFRPLSAGDLARAGALGFLFFLVACLWNRAAIAKPRIAE